MAEKTDTKKLEAEKEAHESPVADLAEEAREGSKVEKREVKEEISEEEREKDLEKEKKEKVKEIEKKEKAVNRNWGEGFSWAPKTKLGREVKEGKIKNIDEILDSGRKILEEQIVDKLINVNSDLIAIGQSKGKFGGGKRRAWRQTQRKTKEGNIPTFSTMAVAGDENGHVGIGHGRAKETLPARDKAIRKAKLNIFKVNRTCAAFDCSCSEPHTIPFRVVGKSGSVKVELIPAPQGTGLVVGNELKKIFSLAGIKDIYSKTSGKKRTTFNLIKACIDALKKTNKENVSNN